MDTAIPTLVPTPDDGPFAHRPAALRAAISPGIVRDALRERWPRLRNRGSTLLDCKVLRVNPRGDGSISVQYELLLERDGRRRSRTVIGALVAGDPASAAQDLKTSLAKRRRRQISGRRSTDKICALDNPPMVISPIGLDPALPGLKILYAPEETLSAMMPAWSGRRIAKTKLLGHRLGKRSISRLRFAEDLEGGARSVIVKFYTPASGRARTVMSVMEELFRLSEDQDAAVRPPRPIACVDSWGALFMEDVAAKSLADLTGGNAIAGMTSAGRTLAALHACPLQVPARHGPTEEIELLERWVGLAGAADLEPAGALRDGLHRVARALRSVGPVPAALIHRDYYEKQLLMAEGRTVLIDYDTLAHGDPAIDIGNFLAHLDLAALQGLDVVGREDAFLKGYGDVSAVGERVLHFRDAARLRLACLYAFTSQWRRLAAPLLESAR